MIENPHRSLKFWHKVQIHCHSSDSDAKRGQTAATVEEAYRDAGYSCVFLTDHNRITPDPGVPGILHIDSAEYGLGRHHTLALGTERTGVPQGAREAIAATGGCNCASIPKRLAHIAELGKAIPVAAHPNARHFCSGLFHPRWCGGGWSLEDLVRHAGHYAGLEVFNANNADRRMWALDRWDELLAGGALRTWGFASDDCHDVHDDRTFDRGWILVNSEIDPNDSRQGLADPAALTRDILENIRSGNFWAVVRHRERGSSGRGEGATRLTISCSQERIHVAASGPCETIEFSAGSSSHRASTSASGSAEFSYDVGAWEDYVRVRVVQKTGGGHCLTAWSQPLIVRRGE